MKILFLGVNPLDTDRLRIDEEIRSIDESIRQSQHRDIIETEHHHAVRVSDLQSLLLRHNPDIVHFSGHGRNRCELILEDQFGNSQTVSIKALSTLFSMFPNIRCVVLNACYSDEQAKSIAQHVDYVIGMSDAIDDISAISFAKSFYQAIGYGKDIRAAFELGCIQIDLASLNNQDVPQLYTKPDAASAPLPLIAHPTTDIVNPASQLALPLSTVNINEPPAQLPKILVDQIREGRVVLFLGEGAFIDAVHPKGRKLINIAELSKLIVDKFLEQEFKDRPLSQIIELAISETSLSEVQEFIASQYDNYYPAHFHKLIPRFVWHAIATTSLNLVVERAYDTEQDKVQQLAVFKKNGERVEEQLKSLNSVMYLKLHGCVTEINNPDTPLILTSEQYSLLKKGRDRLFERLQNFAFDHPFLFVGNTAGDSDLRAVLHELSQVGEAKPRSYILTPNKTLADVRFWETRKFTHIHLSFHRFLEVLDASIPPTFRVLSVLNEKEAHPVVKHFLSDKGSPSDNLLSFLNQNVEYIHKDYKTSSLEPAAFYKGYFVDLSPIIFNWDVKREISDNILSEVFLTTEEEKNERSEFYLISGHAGSGKSIILRRLAWDASVEFDRVCFLLKQSASLEYEPLAELYRLCKKRIFLFIDPVSEYVNTIQRLLVAARKDKLPLTIIGAERNHEWNIHCEDLEAFVTDKYDIQYLVEREIRGLIDLLTRHKSLGHLEGLTFEQQTDALSNKAGRQLLVALHEATLGKPFREIVLDEYRSISSKRAQALYLTVCIFHRLGVPVRAGLISRVHGIHFTEFQQRLFKPLEFIVFADMDRAIRDYVYRSRHSRIAEMIFEEVLVDPQDRYDEYMRILNALDIDYSSDFESFKGLINAKQLLKLFSRREMVQDIYLVANRRFGEHALVLQQEAIFEMSPDRGNLARATELLQRAYKLAPYNRAIAHSLAELARRKAQSAKTDLEKHKFRAEAQDIASRLIREDSVSSHSYHTWIKVGLDDLSELIVSGDSGVIERAIKELEKSITRATQLYPGDEYILDQESQFCDLLNRHVEALQALEKAFARNKRSPYIALRLAKIYSSNQELAKAIATLRACIEMNPDDKDLNFNIAMLLNDDPSAAKTELRYHLRKSFTMGDSNHAAQFWYARYIYLEGEYQEALKIFNLLKDVNVDSRLKQGPRGIVKNGNKPVRFSGVITKLEASYAFITRDKFQDRIFTRHDYSLQDDWVSFRRGDRIVFELAFNYRGPTALHLKHESTRM